MNEHWPALISSGQKLWSGRRQVSLILSVKKIKKPLNIVVSIFRKFPHTQDFYPLYLVWNVIIWRSYTSTIGPVKFWRTIFIHNLPWIKDLTRKSYSMRFVTKIG